MRPAWVRSLSCLPPASSLPQVQLLQLRSRKTPRPACILWVGWQQSMGSMLGLVAAAPQPCIWGRAVPGLLLSCRVTVKIGTRLECK